jgi:uncharacterized OsmC-like protein
MTMELTVDHEAGDRYRIDVRGHVLHCDQPLPDGGTDTAATPSELFVASLASCVAFYAGRYLQRHALPQAGLYVSAEAEFGSKPARIASVSLSITPPHGLTERDLRGLLAVASHCTVHNTLINPPDVKVRLAAGAPRWSGQVRCIEC